MFPIAPLQDPTLLLLHLVLVDGLLWKNDGAQLSVVQADPQLVHQGYLPPAPDNQPEDTNQ